MIDHTSRGHALLSASSAVRWLNCPPSVMLGKDIEEKPSPYAIMGTLAHEIAEARLQNYFYPETFSKRKLTNTIKRVGKDEIWIDKETEFKNMLRFTEEYLDFVKCAALAFDNQPHVVIERKIDFSSHVPGGFGTADCILISGETIHIIDFKSGHNGVTAENNPQLMLYGLGAYNAYRMLYPVKRVLLSIVQPSVPDSTNSWECTIEDILNFAEYAKGQANLAMKGDGDFNPSEKTCIYCPVGGSCRARADRNVELAFKTDTKPALLSNDEIGVYMRQGKDIEKWMEAIKKHALSECLAGRAVKGWKAVEGKMSRTWGDMDAAFDMLKQNGIEECQLWKRVPLTAPQIESVIDDKTLFAKIIPMITVKTGKPALVEESNKKPAITNTISAEDAFKEEN